MALAAPLLAHTTDLARLVATATRAKPAAGREPRYLGSAPPGSPTLMVCIHRGACKRNVRNGQVVVIVMLLYFLFHSSVGSAPPASPTTETVRKTEKLFIKAKVRF